MTSTNLVAEPSCSESPPSPTDWSRCVLCQEEKPEPLQCPLDSKRASPGAGYKTLAENLVQFDKLGALALNLGRLNDGHSIKETMEKHRASWHKSCILKYNNSELKRAEKRKHKEESNDAETLTKFTRQSSTKAPAFEQKCFFCNKEEEVDPLHEATCWRVDERVKRCATILQDQELLAKLGDGRDLMALEVKYHSQCLATLYKRAERASAKSSPADSEKVTHGLVLAELLAYMDETRQNSEGVPVFKLSDLSKLYTERLEQLGIKTTGRLHSTRLKERIMVHFPDLQAHAQGRDVLLAFDKDVGLALKKVLEDEYDDDGMYLAKAARTVRAEMFQMKITFGGSFTEQCQKNTVPKLLLTLVEMILDGPSITDQSRNPVTAQSALTIAQLLLFNSHTCHPASKSNPHHSKDREPPLPLYLGMSVHAHTRKRDLVDTQFDLGLGVSYDRVLATSTDLANTACDQYAREGVVCPQKMRNGLFTTGAIDNIDHNPSSTTSKGSFHGTAISMFQHPMNDFAGECRDRENLDTTSSNRRKGIAPLPETYTVIPPVVLKKKDPPIPAVNGPVKPGGLLLLEEATKEYRYKGITSSWQ